MIDLLLQSDSQIVCAEPHPHPLGEVFGTDDILFLISRAKLHLIPVAIVCASNHVGVCGCLRIDNLDGHLRSRAHIAEEKRIGV